MRFGLSAIKNVGEGAIASILEARRRLGRFRSLHELCAEIDLRAVNKRVLEALVQSGAMDSLGGRRSALAAAIDGAMDWGTKRRDDRESGQASLFGGGGSAPEAPPPPLPDLPDWDDATRLANEKATLGFYVSGHPLESFRELLQDFATHTTASLREAPSGGEGALGGILTALRQNSPHFWAFKRIHNLLKRLSG